MRHVQCQRMERAICPFARIRSTTHRRLPLPHREKIADELHKAGYTTEDDFLHLGEKPSYEEAVRLAGKLMELFSSGKADRVELLYHHFKNMATQVLTHKVYLPVTSPQASVENTAPTTDTSWNRRRKAFRHCFSVSCST